MTGRVKAGRGIATGYGYDALNRLTSVNYNDGATPNVAYTWDTAAGAGVG